MEHQEQSEADPTKYLRDELVDALREGVPESDGKILEKFRTGMFFVPSETTKRINELIDDIPDKEKQQKLRRLYTEVLHQGL